MLPGACDDRIVDLIMADILLPQTIKEIGEVVQSMPQERVRNRAKKNFASDQCEHDEREKKIARRSHSAPELRRDLPLSSSSSSSSGFVHNTTGSTSVSVATNVALESSATLYGCFGTVSARWKSSSFGDSSNVLPPYASFPGGVENNIFRSLPHSKNVSQPEMFLYLSRSL